MQLLSEIEVNDISKPKLAKLAEMHE